MGLICVVLLFTIVPRSMSVWELSSKKQELEKQKVRLEQVNKVKHQQLEELKSPEAIERIAREQLGMVKNGERFVMKVIEQK